MKGLKGLRVGVLVAAAVLVAGVGLLATQAWAASGTASIGSATAAPGEQGVVDLNAEDVGAPGLGAWTVDIKYDPSVISAVSCSALQGGVCNADYAADTVRITGAVAVGMEGDTLLGNVTFECGDEEGVSDLEVSLFTFADGTLGGPLPLDATTVDGTFTCEAEEVAPTPALPQTGMGDGGSSSGLGWLFVVLAAAGAVSLAGVGASRLAVRRS